MSSIDTKVIKKVELDQETFLRFLRNEALSRISVEFSSTSSKLVLQKSFQDTYEGRREAEQFSKTITCTNDLKRYFGVN